MLVSTKLSGILKHKELFTYKWYKRPWWTYPKSTRNIQNTSFVRSLIQVRIILDHGAIFLFYVCFGGYIIGNGHEGGKEEKRTEYTETLIFVSKCRIAF